MNTSRLERPGTTMSDQIATEAYLCSIEKIIRRNTALEAHLKMDQEILLGAWPANQRTRISAICKTGIRYYDRRHKPYFIRRLHREYELTPTPAAAADATAETWSGEGQALPTTAACATSAAHTSQSTASDGTEQSALANSTFASGTRADC